MVVNLHSLWEKGATLFSRISWSIFIIYSPVETGMNIPQTHVIYLLNSLMTS